MNTCLRVLKEIKWILGFYQNLLSISQATFRHCRVRFYAFFCTTIVETAVYINLRGLRKSGLWSADEN